MNSPDSSPLNVSEPHIVQVDPPDPWRPLLVPAIVVIVGLVIAWALFAHFGRSKPDASGSILREVVYPVQVDSEPSQTDSGMEGAPVEQNETIDLVQVRVTNISHASLAIFDLQENIKSGKIASRSFAALPEDVDRLLQRFPDLAALHMQPLLRHKILAPGQSAEGLLVFNYPWTKQQWDQHKDAQIVISFEKGRSLVLPLQ